MACGREEKGESNKKKLLHKWFAGAAIDGGDWCLVDANLPTWEQRNLMELPTIDQIRGCAVTTVV